MKEDTDNPQRWWETTMRRRKGKAKRVHIAARLAENDLPGPRLSEGNWKRITIPPITKEECRHAKKR